MCPNNTNRLSSSTRTPLGSWQVMVEFIYEPPQEGDQWTLTLHRWARACGCGTNLLPTYSTLIYSTFAISLLLLLLLLRLLHAARLPPLPSPTYLHDSLISSITTVYHDFCPPTSSAFTNFLITSIVTSLILPHHFYHHLNTYFYRYLLFCSHYFYRYFLHTTSTC